jgi:pimeloyl-ACP methyl ester carboxylesterase/uncharacterized membrane protein YeaQ/YmgE (transglycosylase-associated protein family)
VVRRRRPVNRRRWPAAADRPTLVAIHGGPAGYVHSHLRPHQDRLGDQALVLYVDLPGHGRSDHGDAATCSPERCADDLVAFCDQLGIVQPLMFGHSMGGTSPCSQRFAIPARRAGHYFRPRPRATTSPASWMGFRTRVDDGLADIAARIFGGGTTTADVLAELHRIELRTMIPCRRPGRGQAPARAHTGRAGCKGDSPSLLKEGRALRAAQMFRRPPVATAMALAATCWTGERVDYSDARSSRSATSCTRRSPRRTPSRTKDTVVLILVLLAVGMAIGWAAQLIMGASRATVDWTLALVAGVLGSFVGGTIGSLLSGDGLDVRPSGIIGSLVGAIIVVLVWQRVIAPRRARR